MSAPTATYADVLAAATRIDGRALQTPLLNSPFIDDIAGKKVWVKAECLQKTGSFKYRGACSAITSALNNSGSTAAINGFIAYSSGNHAQGVACVAREEGLPAVIVMPSDAPSKKVQNTRGYGAEVVFYDRVSESREDIGARLAAARGLTLIKPYDQIEVIAGQGTCGLEITSQAEAIGIDDYGVITCCGGGGLTAGIALALGALAPKIKVYPAEPEGFDDANRSLLTGKREVNERLSGSICDAILTPQLGELTFPIIQRRCPIGLQVSEAEVLKAMKLAFDHLKIVIEPGGAAALAAAIFRNDSLSEPALVVTASGGNVDSDTFQKALLTEI